MKKTYTTPSVTTISMDLEGVIAASLQIGGSGNKVSDENQVLSVDNGGWDSSNWAPAEPETTAPQQ